MPALECDHCDDLQKCIRELASSIHAHQGEQAKQIAALKQGLEEAAALGAAACTLLARILDAERVIPRAEAERDARDFLAGRAVRLSQEPNHD